MYTIILSSIEQLHGIQIWLLSVASLRAFSVYAGYFNRSLFQRGVFSNKKEQVTPLAGRLMAIWTALTCTLCVMCALYPNDQGRLYNVI